MQDDKEIFKEDFHPSGNNRVSLVLLRDLVPIGRTFLKEEERKSILDFCLSKELGQLNDNLLKTERTDWHLHEDVDFQPYCNFLKKHIWDAMAQMTSYPDKRFATEYHTEVDLFDCWFARCKKGGYTDPHDHGNIGGQYSFACYLKIPSNTSSLTFASNSFETKERIIVREGDLLVFPSRLKHWSFDTEEDRCLVSGNFIWQIKRTVEDKQVHEKNENDLQDDNNLIESIKDKIGQLRTF